MGTSPPSAEHPVSVDFWFDPACPFCWVTSRWLERVRPHRAIDVTWHPISLLFKNDIGPDHDFHPTLSTTHGMLRVVEAVRHRHGNEPIGPFYTELGRHVHHRSDLDVDLGKVLAELGLDPDLADARHEEAWDDTIRSAMEIGLDLTGDDVGTPLIAVRELDRSDRPTEGRHDDRVGLFGPVLSALPDLDESLRLWDGFVAVASTPVFFELKRSRNGSPTIPDEGDLD